MKKNKVTGLVGTIVLHVVLLLLLLLVAISKPKAQEEGGVPVMLGNMEMAQGNADPYTLTDVDILDEPQLPSDVSVPEPVPTPPVKTEMITQEDEPTVAVDPQSRNKILEGILELNRQGATIVYTSHYMEEVEQICTRIAIMDKGKNLAIGTTDELKKND